MNARKLGIASALPIAVVCGAVFLPSVAQATVFEKFLDATKFGNLDQHDTNCALVNCGPTAAVNSFAFLQNSYPDVYNGKLVPSTAPSPTFTGTAPTAAAAAPTAADLTAVANKLGSDFMGNCTANCSQGTSIEDFILGKRDYLESVAPGKTVYHAQINFAWRESPPNGTHPNTAKPGFVDDNTKPTLSFLYNELKRGEDVELFMATGADGHYLTLTGIKFDDTNNTGEMAFIDPWTGKAGTADISGLTGGFIETNYKIGDETFKFVAHAVSESPIPEPGTYLVFVIGLITLGLYRRRQLERNAAKT